jgi:hypothetical protein
MVLIAAIACVPAAVVGAMMSLAAAAHDPLGEFSRSGGGVSVMRLAPVFLSWFALVFAMTMVGLVLDIAFRHQPSGE